MPWVTTTLLSHQEECGLGTTEVDPEGANRDCWSTTVLIVAGESFPKEGLKGREIYHRLPLAPHTSTPSYSFQDQPPRFRWAALPKGKFTSKEGG